MARSRSPAAFHWRGASPRSSRPSAARASFDAIAGRSPEAVLAFLRTADDEAIRTAVHDIGTPVVLDLLFTGMAGRYGPRPGRSAGRLSFAVDDDGREHVHVVEVDETGARTVPPGPRERR